MISAKCVGRTLLAAVLFFGGPFVAQGAVLWTVDSSQSFLKLVIPNQPALLNGTPSGNLFLTNQGATTGMSWTFGNQAAISGTLSTDFVSGSSIHFRAGEHNLTADNSGSYAPDFDNWSAGTSKFSPPNGTEDAPFGGQLNTTQAGLALIFFRDIFRFAIRDVAYDLSSGVIPLVANQFSAAATSFSMSDAMLGMRGRDAAGIIPTIPHYLDSIHDLGFAVGGTNGSATATIATLPGVYKLTLPVNVPLVWTIGGTTYTGTAQGTIVATAAPEPASLTLAAFAVAALLTSETIRRRCRARRHASDAMML